MSSVTPAPRDPPAAPRPAGLLSLLRDVLILLAAGGLTWTDTEKPRGRYQ